MEIISQMKNSYFERKNKSENNLKDKEQDSLINGGYMDIRPVNGKRKKWNVSEDENDDNNENNGSYSNYSNSIYNINKTKKIIENGKIDITKMRRTMRKKNRIIIKRRNHIITIIKKIFFKK